MNSGPPKGATADPTVIITTEVINMTMIETRRKIVLPKASLIL